MKRVSFLGCQLIHTFFLSRPKIQGENVTTAMTYFQLKTCHMILKNSSQVKASFGVSQSATCQIFSSADFLVKE